VAKHIIEIGRHQLVYNFCKISTGNSRWGCH